MCPEDITCTQILQKWNATTTKIASNVAVKCCELEFEKASYQEISQRKKKACSFRRKGAILCHSKVCKDVCKVIY